MARATRAAFVFAGRRTAAYLARIRCRPWTPEAGPGSPSGRWSWSRMPRRRKSRRPNRRSSRRGCAVPSSEPRPRPPNKCTPSPRGSASTRSWRTRSRRRAAAPTRPPRRGVRRRWSCWRRSCSNRGSRQSDRRGDGENGQQHNGPPEPADGSHPGVCGLDRQDCVIPRRVHG